MRILNIGTQRYTRVVVKDEPNSLIGEGACHEYEVVTVDAGPPAATVNFQKGPVQEHGVNGCHNEDLLAIIIDRLQHFQNGKFKCRENAIALMKIEEAMMWLRARTQKRYSENKEGTSKI